MMQQPGSPARDDEPVSGGDAEDAGSVAFQNGGLSTPVDETLECAARDAIAQWRQTGAGSFVVGVDPATDAVVFTDRVTGATFPSVDEGRTLHDAFRRASLEVTVQATPETTPSLFHDVFRIAPAHLTDAVQRPIEDDVIRRYEEACRPPEGKDTPPCP